MPEATNETPPRTGRGRRAVERAVGELRRGLAVAVGGEQPYVVLAAEQANDAGIADLARLGEVQLALTAERAQVLKIRPQVAPVVLVEFEARFDAALVCALADPAADLDNPLRGPFKVIRETPATALAAIALIKLARLLPAALLVPLEEAADPAWLLRHDLLTVAAGDVEAYEVGAAQALRQVSSAQVPLAASEDCRVVAFRPPDGGAEHLAIVVGEPPPDQPVLVRLHSECFTGDLLESLRCDCGQQLRGALDELAKEGGILLYLPQEGRGIGLVNKLRAYRLQDQGYDTVEANLRLGFEADERLFLAAAEMLRRLGYDRVRLLTNNPQKVSGLEQFGVEVSERVPHAFPPNAHNERYLATKCQRSGHLL